MRLLTPFSYRAIAFFNYLLKARSARLIHSPFAFDLLTKVIRDKRQFSAYQMARNIRRQLLQMPRKIKRTDYGSSTNQLIAVEEFTKSSAVPAKTGKLLFRLSDHLKPKTILELGTGTGLSLVYLASGSPEAKCVTLEGCGETASIASWTLKTAQVHNVEIVVGEFNKTLPGALAKLEKVGLAFIDGNHREEPTMEYFDIILTKSHEGSCLIFHDIHWSEGMDRAWKRIKAHPRVTVTIDLFDVGLVFFRNQAKEDFVQRW